MVNSNHEKLYEAAQIYTHCEMALKDLTTQKWESLYVSFRWLLTNSDEWWNLVMEIHQKYMPLLESVPELPNTPVNYPMISPAATKAAMMMDGGNKVEVEGGEEKEEGSEQEDE